MAELCRFNESLWTLSGRSRLRLRHANASKEMNQKYDRALRALVVVAVHPVIDSPRAGARVENLHGDSRRPTRRIVDRAKDLEVAADLVAV
jgi:hypothetical protein